MTKSPTQVMVRVTTTATAQLKSASCCHMRMPRLRARAGWMAERVSWLIDPSHKRRISSRMIARRLIFPGVTDKISPTKKVLNLVKLLPPMVDRKIPSATAVEEKTPIMVSLARLVRSLTQVKSKAKQMASATAHQLGSAKPANVPAAMPVKAEWPRASEKKDIFFSTTMVERRPKRGEMTRIASSAFFIKSILPGSAHSKGSRSTITYHKFILLLPPSRYLRQRADGRDPTAARPWCCRQPESSFAAE